MPTQKRGLQKCRPLFALFHFGKRYHRAAFFAGLILARVWFFGILSDQIIVAYNREKRISIFDLLDVGILVFLVVESHKYHLDQITDRWYDCDSEYHNADSDCHNAYDEPGIGRVRAIDISCGTGQHYEDEA